MKCRRRAFLRLAAGGVALPAIARVARAQSFPSRPVTMVVPFAAGGGTDIFARILAEGMRGPLGQTVVIENVAGAGGSIGVARVVHAAPDGYTLSIGTLTTHVLSGALYPLQFDLLSDLAPIAELGYEPLLIAVKNALPVKNLKDLILWLKANPDKATAGIPGAGSTGNLADLSFQKTTGTSFQFVPYRGDGPAVQDLVAGQIDMMIEPSSNFVAQVEAKTVNALAVTSKTRHPGMPNVPTVDEAGLPGFYVSIWFGLWAPKGTPKDIIGKLNAATVAALADPDVKAKLGKLGQQVSVREQQTPDVLGALQKSEADKWWPIIKAANIKGG
ncbi:MAG TPA: tripartite tricarboxylate transporter substrate-binding protein [Xanthobacteraceae bacterium]|jgi:tripartite-type tricarboxylate transporter receptor subunit TctC|nr:tripartite tricarboxylate transporter substrate-binding protein [Xanthobacteraceae bacterium]